MDDAKLFELATQITVAKINNNTIPPSTIGVDDMIENHLEEMFLRVRNVWRRNHNDDNVIGFAPTD